MKLPVEQQPVERLKGVGPSMQAKLNAQGVFTLLDVLLHLPHRYQDRTRVTPIGGLQLGVDAVIEGEIKASDIVFGRRRSLICRLQDNTGTVTLRFFHFNASQREQLKTGKTVRCYGEARRGASGIEFYHPEYRVVSEAAPAQVDGTLTPVYPLSENATQAQWRKLCGLALETIGKAVIAPLPVRASSIDGWPMTQALHLLHKPPADVSTSLLAEGLHPAQRSLAWEELLAQNLGLQQLRQQARSHGAPSLSHKRDLRDRFLKTLPFEPTGAQQRVATEIAEDMAHTKPMLRLVQGDVGSGKTLVAALAALQAIDSGYQVALMAPTEILAEQHLLNFSQWFEPLGIRVAWLAGKLKGKKRAAQMAEIASGTAAMVVGTHALFQEEVEFNSLGLAIIDEQHRFGVHQRLALREKGGGLHPHQLVMTATPIPRTLAMTAYADLDCSVIDELPPGRTPVNTVLIDNERRAQVVERIRAAVGQGQQAYWVCTLIEESEQLDAQAAEATHAVLVEALSGVHIGLVHGRMKPAEKSATMALFKAGEIDVLVATTVIEVGVDVPNASLMVIENAERLGLSQLHQLRGRVGRGARASHCVLMYQNPLGYISKQRLQAMRQSTDGFWLAEKDLELRGPGELLGTRQTGVMQLRIADLQRDSDLLEDVREAAQTMVQEHPEQVQPLIQRWLGNRQIYGQV